MTHRRLTLYLFIVALILLLEERQVPPPSMCTRPIQSSPLNTGITVNTGDWLTISSNPADTWVLGPDGPPSRTCNADGLTAYGYYTYGSSSFLYGAMVAKIGSAGSFFLVGTNYGPQQLTTGGTLYLMNWDSNTSDNSGFITAAVNTVPVPPSLLLLGSGLLGLAIMRFRKV